MTAKAPPARPPRDTYEPEAGAVTAKALRPARPQRDSHQPAVPAATAKGPQPARVPRDSYEPKAPTAPTKAPQPARLPRDSYEPEPRAAPAKAPRAARPPRDSYQPEAGAATIKPPRVVRVPRDSYESDEPRYPPVIEAEPTFPDIELDLAQEDLESADYDTLHERDLTRAYELDDDQPVAAPPARHTPRRTAPKEKHQKKRSSLSFGVWARLLAVLLILAGVTATISWHWSTIADLYQFFGRIGQQLQNQASGDNPAAKPEFWPRVPHEQASGQAPGTAAPGGQTAPAVASLVEADPSDPKGKRYVGSVIWRTETVSAGPGVAPELAVRADIEIPERRMTMSWSIRRNTDKNSPGEPHDRDDVQFAG